VTLDTRHPMWYDMSNYPTPIQREAKVMKFRDFGKISRMNRDCVVTEKIDGTNAAIHIEEIVSGLIFDPDISTIAISNNNQYLVGAQSRSRLISPKQDNHGFAKWVWENKDELASTLGPGTHFGEWMGSGINRGYGLKEKRFYLFNTSRWENIHSFSDKLYCVPVLYKGPFSTTAVNNIAKDLRIFGSEAVLGYDRPEGVIVYHTAGNFMMKVTCENDEKPKKQA
jgi:hypothetical protein